MKKFANSLLALGIIAIGMVIGCLLALLLDQTVGAQTNQTIAPITCALSASINSSTISTGQVVAGVAGKKVDLCGFVMNGAGATTAKLVFGTGSTCTSPTDVTPALTLAAASTVAFGGGVGVTAKGTAGQTLCVTNTAAIQVSGRVAYTIAP